MSTLGSSSQLLVPIKEIREGVLVLKTGALRAVLLISSINFALKSNEEQEAIIARFQEFLNSLDFSAQIVIQSRKLNMEKYLERIKEMEKIQENELLRIQTAEYYSFIKELVSSMNIMNKTFYVIIPYSMGESAKKKGILNLFKETATKGMTQVDEQRFHQIKSQLWQRVDHIAASLSSMSIRAVPLNTEELIELFYKLYNPGEDSDKVGASTPEEMGLQL
ncbi:hypothetical protein D4R86_04350 [bacterium]|nr:MAG: hypothetical protein D4R86_04350 [bacterium]